MASVSTDRVPHDQQLTKSQYKYLKELENSKSISQYEDTVFPWSGSEQTSFCLLENMSHLHDNLIENLLTGIGLKLILHSISRKRTCPVCTAENISEETLYILVLVPVSRS